MRLFGRLCFATLTFVRVDEDPSHLLACVTQLRLRRCALPRTCALSEHLVHRHDGRMAEDQTVKEQLPYPYNQDLSSVLRRLDRRTPFSRKRLANDPVTAAYIAAGMRLVQSHLGPGAVRVFTDPDDENSLGRPLLNFLSQRSVAAEVAKNPQPFPRVGSTSTLRSTWRSQSDYVADLLSFGLWSLHEPGVSAPHIEDDAELLLDGPDFVGAAHRLCYYDLATVVAGTTFRLELIAVAAAEGDDAIQQVLEENHQGAIAPWKQLYEAMFESRGLRLRPDISLDEFAEMLASLACGYALQQLATPSASLLDHDNRRTPFGTAALALLLGCAEADNRDDSPGTSVVDAVKGLIYYKS